MTEQNGAGRSSATDELRRMLDERGVEWRDSSDENVLHTTWNGMSCWFDEFPDGWTAWGMAMRGTPEQAIAATLGRGECRIERRQSAWGGFTEHCSECGADLGCDTRNTQKFCPNCGRRVEQ